MNTAAEVQTFGNPNLPDPTPDRPLVTFALFAYNQEKYIREAVEGAFSQTYEPLEIILSDDCSSDRTFEIMQEMAAAYEGPHEVRLRRHDTNEGIACHVNQLITAASGKYMVAAAGDDVSQTTRTEMTVSVLQENPAAEFCETAYISIDETGIEISKKTPIFPTRQELTLADLLNGHITGLTGAARTYRLSTLRFFSPLEADCPTEDSPFLLRCLLSGRAIYLPNTSIKRRTHGNNLSGEGSLRAMNLENILSQYVSDIDFAYGENLIALKVHRRALGWARRTIFKRRSVQQKDNGILSLRSELKALALERLGFTDQIFRIAFLLKISLMKRNSR